MALQKGEGRYEIIHKNWSVTARADEFDAYVTQPDTPGHFGCVVVVQDVWGITPQLQEFAKLLSRMGYLAIVPNLYYRIGDLPPDPTREEAEWLAGRLGDGRMLADLEDAAAFLSSVDNADTGRIACVGFGLGGRMAILYAARHPNQVLSVVAVAPQLGKVELPDGSLRPRTALDEAAGTYCPVLALFGGQDALTDPGETDKLREALGSRGATVTYPGARREFLDEMSADYDASVATDAYGRIIGVLDAAVGYEPRP